MRARIAGLLKPAPLEAGFRDLGSVDEFTATI